MCVAPSAIAAATGSAATASRTRRPRMVRRSGAAAVLFMIPPDSSTSSSGRMYVLNIATNKVSSQGFLFESAELSSTTLEEMFRSCVHPR
ncbi:hypothetical protein ACFPRL_05965 [Pseudoclavibacter helvolus]